MTEEPKGVRLGLGFWLLIIFALACILAGLAVAKLGPLLFPAEPAAVLEAPNNQSMPAK